MKDDTTKRVFLIEEHPIVIMGLEGALSSEPDLEITEVCDDRRKALVRLEDDPPDLVILEIGISGTSGLDLLQDLKARGSKVKILCYSFHEEVFYAERTLRAGAYGYLMKTSDKATILKAIRAVLNGQVYLSESMGRRVLGRIAMAAEGEARSPIHQLSNRELQIIHHIGVNRDNRQIARMTGVSLKTVEAHRSKIKEKLQLRTTSDLIRFATHWVEREESFVSKWA